jgi:hypothetical protein
MGEQALCVAIELAHSLETFKQYSFIPKAFVHTLSTSLFALGDLLSSLLNLCIRRVDAFFEVLQSLPLELHAKKIAEGPVGLISELLTLVKDNLHSAELLKLVMEKVIISSIYF